MRLTRFDIHIIVNILIGVLIGGVLVYGLSHRELAPLRAKVDQLEVQVRLLQLGQSLERRAP